MLGGQRPAASAGPPCGKPRRRLVGSRPDELGQPQQRQRHSGQPLVRRLPLLQLQRQRQAAWGASTSRSQRPRPPPPVRPRFQAKCGFPTPATGGVEAEPLGGLAGGGPVWQLAGAPSLAGVFGRCRSRFFGFCCCGCLTSRTPSRGGSRRGLRPGRALSFQPPRLPSPLLALHPACPSAAGRFARLLVPDVTSRDHALPADPAAARRVLAPAG